MSRVAASSDPAVAQCQLDFSRTTALCLRGGPANSQMPIHCRPCGAAWSGKHPTSTQRARGFMQTLPLPSPGWSHGNLGWEAATCAELFLLDSYLGEGRRGMTPSLPALPGSVGEAEIGLPRAASGQRQQPNGTQCYLDLRGVLEVVERMPEARPSQVEKAACPAVMRHVPSTPSPLVVAGPAPPKHTHLFQAWEQLGSHQQVS